MKPNKKYLLRGGLIGAIIAVVLYFMVYLLVNVDGPWIIESTGFFIAIFFFIFPNIIPLGLIINQFTPCNGEECLALVFKLSIFPAIIEFFLLGMLIAWLIKRERRIKMGAKT